MRGNDIPDQFDAYPMQVWKWLENDVCSPLQAFPKHSFNVNLSYASAAEYCSFWYGGSAPQTNDICEQHECKAEIIKYIPVVYVYPSYNLPCGAERVSYVRWSTWFLGSISNFPLKLWFFGIEVMYFRRFASKDDVYLQGFKLN